MIIEHNFSNLVVKVVMESIKNGESYSLKGSGNSMKPFLNENDTIIVSSVNKYKHKVGDILLYERLNGQFVIHRIYNINKNGTYEFIGDNQFWVEKGIKEEQLKACVEKVIRNGREIDCKQGLVRMIMTIRMWLRVKFYALYCLVKRIVSACKVC